MKQAHKIISLNRKARHDFFVESSYEAGIELAGTEVKSLREGKANLKQSYCFIENGEIFVYDMHISPFEKGNIFNHDPVRKRKLLMHKNEIFNLYAKVKTKGYTLIPLSLYFKGSYVKIEVGLCKGKKLYDKRADIAKRDAQRKLDIAIKEKNRQ